MRSLRVMPDGCHGEVTGDPAAITRQRSVAGDPLGFRQLVEYGATLEAEGEPSRIRARVEARGFLLYSRTGKESTVHNRVSEKCGMGLLLAVLCTSGVSAAQSGPSVRIATPFATGHILADTAFKLEEFLENRGFTVTVATSVLNEQTINPQMTACDPNQRVADIMLTGGQPIQDWAPQYFFFNGPYVIADYDHFENVWFSDLGEEARDLMSQNGNLAALGTVYRGFRQFTSNSPINGPADFVDLLLRLPAVPDWISVWSSLGVQPVTVPLGGIYEALRTGQAEASEGDLTQITSLELYEVQTHLSLTSHLVGFGLAMANECFLSSLSSGDRNKVKHELEAAVDFGSQKMFTTEAAQLANLDALGMTIITPNAAAIRTAAEPAINNLFATKWTVTTWAEVLDLQ
jgi:TRAP-type transport system periplasmic protein